MDIAYKRAYTDVLYIINTLDKRLKDKISSKFIEFMTTNCDRTYTPSNISLNKPDTLPQETKNVLSLIYRNYLDDKNIYPDYKENELTNYSTSIKENIEELNTIPENKAIALPIESNGIFRKMYNFMQRLFNHGGTSNGK